PYSPSRHQTYLCCSEQTRRKAGTQSYGANAGPPPCSPGRQLSNHHSILAAFFVCCRCFHHLVAVTLRLPAAQTNVFQEVTARGLLHFKLPQVVDVQRVGWAPERGRLRWRLDVPVLQM